MEMKMEIKIGNRVIGDEQPCFIIAEAGVNHNGKLELAKKLVDIAKEAGADAVKFQTFKTERLVTKNVNKADYQKRETAKSQHEMLKNLELQDDEFSELKKYCNSKGILFLSTPFDHESLELVDELCPVFKISSTDTNNYPFLEEIAKKGKPIILSTGMSTMDEIKEAVGTIKNAGNNNLILLQCVSAYPTPLEEANVKAMLQLKKTGVKLVGYSDHTLGDYAIYAAVALGASVVEKHFTLDKNMDGPDHKASANPEELKKIINGIRDIEKSLGSGIKTPSESEKENIKIMRKKIVAARNIMEGERITKEMVEIKRASNGAEPENLEKILGKKILKKIEKNQGIELSDVI